MFKLYIGICLLSLCDASSFNTSKSSDVPGMVTALKTTTGEIHAWSGGFCLASVAEAGWLKSAVINPVMSLILQTALPAGILPLMTATASGGSMFAIRYFTLRTYPSATKWSYPCYLLSLEFREVCYFHGDFGTISNECFSENLNTIMLATSSVYSGLMMAYGGPLGVVSVFAFVYYPFLSSLPLKAAESSWAQYVKKYVMWNTKIALPSNWASVHTIDDPKQAGQPLYNYGFNSYLSRAGVAYAVTGKQWTISKHNTTASWVVTASANTQTGMQMIPFSFAGKDWDSFAGEAAMAPIMKLMSLMLSFVMVKKMIGNYQLLASNADISGCIDCPIMDAGYSDGYPMAMAVASAALINPGRPTMLVGTGAQAAMTTIKYLSGLSPMGLWTGSGLNLCPFVIPSLCEMTGKLSGLITDTLPEASYLAVKGLESAYSVYRPDTQLITPYCGDPLTFDKFEGLCAAEGVCDMWVTTLPSTVNKVPFTPDPYTLVLVSTLLYSTPVSARFVNAYLPESVWWIPYYENMDQWFPNFSLMAPAKGGLGFTSVAGNALMDYMTYLGIRLVAYLFKTKLKAKDFASGTAIGCDYKTYQKVEMSTLKQTAFLTSQSV